MSDIYHRDVLHQEIKVGDSVVFVPPGWMEHTIGTVIKLTPKGVTCDYKLDGINKTCNRNIDIILKVNEQIKVAKEENPEYFI